MSREILLFLLLIVVANNSYSQSELLNQKDSLGNKKGYWEYYHDNGEIESRGSYGVEMRLLSVEQLFAKGLFASDSMNYTIKSYENGIWESYDSVGTKIIEVAYDYGLLIGKKDFYYNEDGQLFKTVIQEETTFYGSNEDLLIDKLNFFVTGKIGDTIKSKIDIKSNSENDINLFFKSTSKNILLPVNKGTVKPKGATNFVLCTVLTSGNSLGNVNLEFATNSVKINIQSFGYHLSSDDFRPSKNRMFTVELEQDTLVLLRKYSGSELKIYDYKKDNNFKQIETGKSKPIATYPLSFEKAVLNLSALERGEYLLRLVDYKNKTSNYLRLVKE